MSDGILLEKQPRGTLLPVAARIARLQAALPQIQAVLEGETDPVAVQATLACLLWETLVQCNWCGFYRVVAPGMLAVGPYQGGLGCRITFVAMRAAGENDDIGAGYLTRHQLANMTYRRG